MLKSRTTLSAIFAGLALITTHSVAAQGAGAGGVRSNTQGMVLGLHLNGSSLAFEGEDSENGGGAGALIGFGFTRRFMLYVGLDAAKVKINNEGDDDTSGDYTLAHLDIGVRYSFANPGRAWVPYLNVAATGRSASASVQGTDISLTGPAFTGGGGIQYFFNPKFALDANLQYSTGKFNKFKVGGVSVDVNDADNSNSTRFNIGVRFYPNIGTALHK